MQRFLGRSAQKPANRAQQVPKQRRPLLGPWRAVQPRWTATVFLIGSICFLLASLARLPALISTNRTSLRIFVLSPYLAGSLCYTAGCAFSIGITLRNWTTSRRLYGRKSAERESDAEVWRTKLLVRWAWWNVIGDLVAVSGGLLINYACYTDLYWGSKAELVFTTDEQVLWQITAPTMLGRALFMVAGYINWAARNHSWSLAIHHGSRHFWWTSLLYFVGTGFFYVGWFFTVSPILLAPGLLVDNWFWILAGYVAGSCMLFGASYVMLQEVADMPGLHGYERLPY